MITITPSHDWRRSYPGACFGVLVLKGVENSRGSRALDERKSTFETSLRSRHERKNRKEIGMEESFVSYGRYYKKFGQGYPVLHQVETVALKGKPLSSSSPLVTAMFMAELKNGLLTAVHDIERERPPLFLDVSKGVESFRVLGGKERTLPQDDMYVSDGEGVLSSIICGPDERTAVNPGTTRILFTVYGVPSIPAAEVRTHLEETEELVRLISPRAERQELLILMS